MSDEAGAMDETSRLQLKMIAISAALGSLMSALDKRLPGLAEEVGAEVDAIFLRLNPNGHGEVFDEIMDTTREMLGID